MNENSIPQYIIWNNKIEYYYVKLQILLLNKRDTIYRHILPICMYVCMYVFFYI